VKRSIPIGFLVILAFTLAFDAWGGKLHALAIEHVGHPSLGILLAIWMMDGTFFMGALFIVQHGFPSPGRKPFATWVLAGYMALAGMSGVELVASLFRAGMGLGTAMKVMDTHPEQIQHWIIRSWIPEPVTTWTARNPWMHLLDIAVMTGILATLLQRLERKQDEAARLEAEARNAREQALRAKLAPHFIFNTLNTLHAQIEADPRLAQATTEKLAQVFRQVVQVSDQVTIPLRQELSFVEAYLGIEQARLGERLKVRFEVPEDLEEAEIPPLSLQVLVENAVKHGIASCEKGGEIRITARREDPYLRLEVMDPGTGISQNRNSIKGTGTALETLRKRLETPEDLRLEPMPEGFCVGFRWRLA